MKGGGCWKRKRKKGWVTARRLHEEVVHTRALEEEQERLSEIRRFQKAIRRDREEEEHQKAIKKKKRNEIHEDYLNDFPQRSNNRKIPERISKRKAVLEEGIYSAGYAPVSKRRRGGEVGLSNILENIVDALKNKQEISYLFLKPVSKKEAPDYLDKIQRPMDLSLIRDRARTLKYKSRSEFRRDVWQIAHNAHRYNDGRNPGIPPLADQLLEYCDFLLDQYTDELNEAEASIQDGDS